MNPTLGSEHPYDQEFGKIQKWLNNPHREADTQLVTKGHILEPPFQASYKVNKDLMEVTISGSNDSIIVLCNRVISSQFRTKQLGLFLFDESGMVVSSKTIGTMARGHQLILKKFPPESVFGSKELYANVQSRTGEEQKHARRRWKELKYDFGFDVDYSEHEKGSYKYWRGPSNTPINDPNIRPDDQKIRKVFLPILAKQSCKEHNDSIPHCNRCDAKVYFKDFAPSDEQDVESDEMGLLDHRRPVFQGGDDTADNLQIFCQPCNNIKNTVCRRCPYNYNCDACSWAFPEKVRSRRVVLVLDQGMIDTLKTRYGNNIESKVIEDLKRLYEKD